MKVYHYSKIKKWQDICHGASKREEPGLRPNGRMGHEDKEAWETAATFALLDPSPENWTDNDHFRSIWHHLKHEMGKLLLEVEIDSENDEVFVVDRGHIEGFLYEGKRNRIRIPKKYKHPSRKEAERAYMESKVPLDEYLAGEKNFGYSLPEVAILKDIPIERVKISEEQPLLVENLEKYSGEMKECLVNEIKEIPELNEWYGRYKEKLKESKKIQDNGLRMSLR